MVNKMSICHSCFYVDFTIKAKNTSKVMKALTNLIYKG